MTKLKYPQFINIDLEIKTKYMDPLIGDPNTIFFGRELGEIYALAAVYGFNNKHRKPTKKLANVRVFDNWKDEYKVLFRAIAAADMKNNFDILLDGARTLKIVEEYANGGAQKLYEDATSISGERLHDKIFDVMRTISPANHEG